MLRYVPPIRRGFTTLVFVSYFAVLLVLFLVFTQYGIISVLIFTLAYTIFMLFAFITLSQRHYIQLLEGEGVLIIHRTFKKIMLDINQISKIDLFETKRSYILSIGTKDKTKDYSLSGSLSFEEPPFVPFLRQIETLKPTIELGDYCRQILHGDANFNPWSPKMYYAYWTYIVVVVVYYLALLVALNILK